MLVALGVLGDLEPGTGRSHRSSSMLRVVRSGSLGGRSRPGTSTALQFDLKVWPGPGLTAHRMIASLHFLKRLPPSPWHATHASSVALLPPGGLV